MDGALIPAQAADTLPSLVRRAADQLALAANAAEVLDARDMASVAYDAAKSAARFARAKGAHDELIAKVHRAQADALEIEAMAKRRLADEYDAAQERGEVRPANARTASTPEAVSAADIGLTHKDIHEARQIRDAEVAEPGIISRTIMERLHAGHEPTKAAVRQAVIEVVSRPSTGAARTSRSNPSYQPNPAMDDAVTIGDSCMQIAEAFERRGPTILDAIPMASLRGNAVQKITRARNALNAILEERHGTH